MRVVINKAQSDPQRVVLAEGHDEKTIRAAYQLVEQGIAEPVLIGDADQIESTRRKFGLEFDPVVVDPETADVADYADRLYELRQRKGVTRREADELIRDGNYLRQRDGRNGRCRRDAHRPDAPLPVGAPPAAAGHRNGRRRRLRGRCLHADVQEPRHLLCGHDGQSDPDTDVLAEVTKHTAELARRFNVEPRAAMLSYSNFGSVENSGRGNPPGGFAPARRRPMWTSTSTARCRPTPLSLRTSSRYVRVL